MVSFPYWLRSQFRAATQLGWWKLKIAVNKLLFTTPLPLKLESRLNISKSPFAITQELLRLALTMEHKLKVNCEATWYPTSAKILVIIDTLTRATFVINSFENFCKFAVYCKEFAVTIQMSLTSWQSSNDLGHKFLKTDHPANIFSLRRTLPSLSMVKTVTTFVPTAT